MSERKRFSFDDEEGDTVELSKDDLISSSTTNTNIPSNDKIFDDEDNPYINAGPTSKDGDELMKKKKKGKFKIKKWQIALIAFLSIVIVFVIYVFVAGGNDGPVYGDRCASLLAIDKEKFPSVEEAIKADPSVNSISIEVDCRIITITMNFADNTTSDTAKQLATNALHSLDDALGQPKEEGKAYSNLLGTADGRGQYNVKFFLTSNGDSNFPLHGTKHPSSDDIYFTGANVVDQAATDRATSTVKGE